MTRRSHRAPWVLAALGVLLIAGLIAAAAIEHTEPTAANPSDPWAEPTRTTTVTPGSTRSATPTATPGASSAPAGPTYVFPVAGRNSYGHTHHDYPASDLIAACGLPFRAVTAGVILEVSRTDSWTAATNDGAERGGLFVSLLGDDGVRYYGSHLRAVTKGIEAGVRVRAGDRLGDVGDTGDASACHLHFGISPPCALRGDWWVRRGEIWPWSYLDSWRAGGQASPVKEIIAWQKQHGCPGAP